MMLDALYVNGRFHTLDPARPQAHALGVFGGLIVGLDEEVEGLPTERLVDLGGAPVVPGFHDAHHHLSARGHALVFCDVSPQAAPTLEALYAVVARHAATLGPNDWLRGSGYVDSVLGGHPTREALDAVTGGRPAFLSHASGHGGVVNSEAVRRVSGDPDRFPDVDAGFVERRGDGSLTGFIAERAVEPVSALLRPQPLEAHVHAIGLASRAALADGLTSVTEPGISGKLTGNGPGDLAAFQLARDRGLLSVRTTVMPEFPALHPVAKAESDLPGFGLDLGLRSGLGDDWLRVGGVKLFGDGALSARTAALSCAY
ncbi:MAG: amidohydrolase family protein, partial [Propionibacteriaceae bacterium]|nr:amidohydrolase family protein [Propionibacteriaceae bacterium]